MTDKTSNESAQTKPSILDHFAWAHLPPNLAQVSELFGVLANKLVEVLPDNVERDLALQRLLESKDSAVRSARRVRS